MENRMLAWSDSYSSVRPETVFLPDLCAMLKKLSSEYHTYACGNFFRMPRSLVPRLPDLEQKSSFLDGHYSNLFLLSITVAAKGARMHTFSMSQLLGGWIVPEKTF